MNQFVWVCLSAKISLELLIQTSTNFRWTAVAQSFQLTHPPTLSWTGNEYRPKGGDALHLGSKAGWLIPRVDKLMGGR